MLYDLGGTLESRSISFENPTGAKGAGGTASSPLGVGRKGDAVRTIPAGAAVTLADIEGPGTVRHIWMTTLPNPKILRGAVLRIWWDGQAHPSVECPLGDFFGFAHGQSGAFETAVHSVGPRYALNFWLPMPFASRARIEIVNEHRSPFPLFYQVDYTIGDAHPADLGRLHVAFRRANPTVAGEDFEILPRREGRGRYLGAVLGVRPLSPDWWGEGEVKIRLDGDGAFATIVGTGTEDYVGLSFGIQPHAFRYHGATWRETDTDISTGRVSIYRWHLPDPVLWRRDICVTIQQIGLSGPAPRNLEEYKAGFVNRADDWSAAAFWYEPVPSAPLPPLAGYAARIADLPMPAR